jgi:GH18 family chitinase
MKKILTVLILVLTLQMSAIAEFRVVGYIPNYSTHPEATKWTLGNGSKIPPREILQHLTHLMFFSMALEGTYYPNGTTASEIAALKAKGAKGELDTQNFGFYRMQDLRDATHSAGAKFILVLGGYGISTPEFATLAASSTARNNFAINIKNYLVTHNIDGVDVDWEFPNGNAGYENFRLLIEALKSQLTPLGKTVSIAINPDLMSNMSTVFLKSADFVNVMTYDLTSQDHAPLNAYQKMEALSSKGVDKANLTYGVPFYGRNQGGYGGIARIYSYLYGLGKMANNVNSTSVNGTTYYYNGPDRISAKTTWAKDNGYGGIMIWDINHDIAFSNSSSLLRAIANANGTLSGSLSSLAPLSSEIILSSKAPSSTIPLSSRTPISSSSVDLNDPYHGSNCVEWKDGSCFNGINYDYCQNNRMSTDGVYGYKCKASQGAYCNYTEPTASNTDQWWSRVTCTYPEKSSVASSSKEIVSSSSEEIESVLEMINSEMISQNSHFVTLNLQKDQNIFIVSPSGKLLFSERLKAGSHNLKAGRFPNKVLIRQ